MQFIDKQKIMPEYIDRTLENLLYVEKNQPSTYVNKTDSLLLKKYLAGHNVTLGK